MHFPIDLVDNFVVKLINLFCNHKIYKALLFFLLVQFDSINE